MQLVPRHFREEMSQSSANILGMSREKAIFCVLSAHWYFFCLQGSYWAIDTNPKEDALPTRPKKRPRSGERVSVMRETLRIPKKTHFSTYAVPLLKFLPPSLLGSAFILASLSVLLPQFSFPFALLSLPLSPTLSLPHADTHTLSRSSYPDFM